MERVIREKPFPDEIPECIDRLTGIATAGGFVDRRKKRRALRLEVTQDRSFARRELPRV